jgi:hypothetical protein
MKLDRREVLTALVEFIALLWMFFAIFAIAFLLGGSPS